MSFKVFLFRALATPLFRATELIGAILVEHFEEHFYEIIVNSDRWFRKWYCYVL